MLSMHYSMTPSAASQHTMQRKFSLLDGITCLAVLTLIGYIFYQLTYSLNYKWNWSIIPTYLFRIHEDGTWRYGVLMQGFFITIKLSIWGTLLAALLGTIVGLMSISRRLFLRLCSRTYVELIRNIPALVMVFIFYYFVSDQIMPLLHIDEFSRSLSPEKHWIFSLFFSQPEMGTVGLTEEQALEKTPNLDIYKSSFRPMKHTLSIV